MKQQLHIPVMLKEAMEYLKLKPHDIVCDATLGLGGHSERILEKIAPSGRLVGIDRDEESLAIARDRLRQWSSICDFVHGNFADIDTIAQNLNIKKFDAILFDLGVSTYQLDDPERGFSFKNEGPLDMRLDRSSYISAYDLLNNLTEEEISTLLWNFGQERWHTRIAHALIQERERHPIATTVELADIVARSVPSRFRYKYY
ncbi:MAG: 16S rRNA (cytosine(1402)-N(4))-methyltransferase RsmH, partial [Candidatus Omnitrophica bacterium]|nr:16S rRNA (cytosine(1402)-N(4))-methyltransferase RsmH [Candidatus Omnitrophota bacterium]